MIRRAEINDLRGILEIQAASITPPWTKESLLNEIENSLFLVFVENGRVSGYINLKNEDITAVAVAPGRRRRGIAKVLFNELFTMAQVKTMFLEVRESNTAAAALYKSLGFEQVSIRKNYYEKPLEHALVFKKELEMEQYILAIETSCDETAAAVLKGENELLSSVVLSQIDVHKVYGGVVPEIASRCHIEAISGIVDTAVKEAGIGYDRLTAVAVTAWPGLIGALLVGVGFAKALAFSLGVPLIPVHHIKGHAASLYLSNSELKPPFLCLVVSGGHTHILEVRDYTDFKVIGRTRDDAAGECFDKVARVLGFPYPGGPEIDRAAKSGDKNAFKFPKPKIDGAPFDFSFSGLKSAVINEVNRARQKGITLNRNDVAAAFSETVTDILTGALTGAAKKLGYKKIAIAGGVSANSAFREKLKNASAGLELYLPEPEYCGDNAAFIAKQAYYELKAGNIAGLELNAEATMEI